MQDMADSADQLVSVTTDAHGVATIRVHRPPVNALSPPMWAALADAARQVADDDGVRAVVLWGGPSVFAAGTDAKVLASWSVKDAVAGGAALTQAMTALARVPKVMIAAINGHALGSGCELALTADFRYAAEDAQLGQPEILLGLIPGGGGTQRLQRLVGPQKAREMIYGGSFYSAAAALQMGLVDRVLPPEEVYPAAVDAARRYASGPWALRAAKQAITEGADLDLDAALRLEAALFVSCFASDDARNGLASQPEHGPGTAVFTGR